MDYWEKANHTWTKDSTRYILTPSQKSRELFYYVQEVGHFSAFKPYFTERENLPSYLMKFTLSGTGELTYGNQVYELKRGDIFLIDCSEYQHYKTISEEPWEMVWIHFYGGNSKIFYDEFIKDGTNTFKTSQIPEKNLIHQVLKQIIKLQEQPNVKTDFQVSVMIHELLNELILQKYQLDFLDEDIPNHVLKLKDFLDKNFKKIVTLDYLAEIFLLNKFQLNKEFSKYIGVPPIDYQINKKISYAKELLRYSDFSIKEISLEIGIENFAYFSRLFKKRTGLTPSKYRKIG